MSDLKEQIESSFDRLALVLNERRKELLDSLYSEEQTSCSTNNDDKQITFTLDLEGLERTLRSIGELTRTGFVASRCSLKWQRTTEFVLQLRDSAGNPFSLPSSESDFRSLVDLYLVEEKKKSRLNFKIRNQDTSQGSYVIHFTPPHKGLALTLTLTLHLSSFLILLLFFRMLSCGCHCERPLYSRLSIPGRCSIPTLPLSFSSITFLLHWLSRSLSIRWSIPMPQGCLSRLKVVSPLCG